MHPPSSTCFLAFIDQCFAYDQPLLWPDQTTQKIQKYPFMRGRGVFLTQKHEMGPVELSPRNPAIHSHAFASNLTFGSFLYVFVLAGIFWFCLVGWGPRSSSRPRNPAIHSMHSPTICFPKELSPIHLNANNIVYLTTILIIVNVKEKTKK